MVGQSRGREGWEGQAQLSGAGLPQSRMWPRDTGRGREEGENSQRGVKPGATVKAALEPRLWDGNVASLRKWLFLGRSRTWGLKPWLDPIQPTMGGGPGLILPFMPEGKQPLGLRLQQTSPLDAKLTISTYVLKMSQTIFWKVSPSLISRGEFRNRWLCNRVDLPGEPERQIHRQQPDPAPSAAAATPALTWSSAIALANRGQSSCR